jgi:hypothetical protein
MGTIARVAAAKKVLLPTLGLPVRPSIGVNRLQLSP